MPKLPYAYLRGLEVEGRHPADAGGWLVTVRRLEIGEGLPREDDPQAYIDSGPDDPLPPAPRIAPERLWHRPHGYYRRLRSSAEIRHFLAATGRPVIIGLRLSAGWASPPGGEVVMPQPGEPLPRLWHAVMVFQDQPNRQRFHFQNWWSDQWGDRGTGYLPYEYFDTYGSECWGEYDLEQWDYEKKTRSGDRQETRWSTTDDAGHRVYGFEAGNGQTRRMAWAYAVGRDGALEVEEFYVRPEFRRNGLGAWLADRIRELAHARGQALRVWVPFADARSESPGTARALAPLARRLGVRFRPCPVRWAAYLATDEAAADSSPEPIEPALIPERPRSALNMLQAGLAALGMLADGGNGVAVQANGPPVHVARSAGTQAASFPEVGTPGWEAMNQRRAELIEKDLDGSLTDEERAEYEGLQDAALAAATTGRTRPDVQSESLRRLRDELRSGSER